ncbi:MAG: hypothetical protein HKN28_04680 [Alphaproteobacteria bacterium]|nr:hypothetical protein [Alphaproteobacteria bacterium]
MRILIATFVAAGLMAFTAAPALAADPVTGLVKADPQPAAESLNPGLGVTYYAGVFNSTDEIPGWAEYKKGKKGEPILMLDYNVGDGEVLTSGRVDEVAADIRGFIRFDTAGTYVMAMQSNDGVDLTIGGKSIIKDTEVHADRFSELVPVEITEPGWYPFHLLYFEKRVTSTVELFWNPPGDGGTMDFVPAEAFAHIP